MRTQNVLLMILAIVGLFSLPAISSAQSYAEHSPGHKLHVEAIRAFEAGQYRLALDGFRSSARWADKLSQFNVGIIYYNGHGVDADPARAWAWFELSAERRYPKMGEMADRVAGELNPAQRAEARRILEEELLPVYGDEVAVRRTARRMDRERRNVAGSRTGSVGAVTVITASGDSVHGSRFFDAKAWDFKQIVQAEMELFDALGTGRVELRDVEAEPEEDQQD